MSVPVLDSVVGGDGHVTIFFTTHMATILNQPNSKKINIDQRSPLTAGEDSNCTESVVRSWPRFLIIETANASEKTLASLSPFVIERAMKGFSSDIQNVKKLRSGVLLVEVNREAQAKNLLGITEFASVPERVSAHRSLNTCTGVIRSPELSRLSSDELLAELKEQGVTATQNIFQTRDGQKKKTATIILTFSMANPPPRIKAGYESVAVDPYIPNPLRCFKCQQFGHGQFTCTRKPICAKCGLDAHGDESCSTTSHCANCKGDHPAFAPICPLWQKEKEICKIKTLRGISFADAKKFVAAGQQPTGAGVSYSSALVGC